MHDFADYIVEALLIGLGATVLFDLWSLGLKQLFDLPPSNWRLVGRWVGYFPHGRFVHESVARAAPVAGELAIGWGFHYFIGALYGVVLVVICGPEYLEHPALLPALILGLATVAAPFFIMQPGMGLGVAGAKSPQPGVVRLRSISNHVMFGVWMYVIARGLKFIGT